MGTERNRRARALFDGIAERYDLWAEVLSLWQNRRWRRFLVSRLDVVSGQRVLDLNTGTAGVAIEVAKTYGARIVGVDLSERMLERGRRNVQRVGLEHRVTLVQGRAEQLDYTDVSFDAVTYAYLLRYVDSVEETVAEAVRVLKPGGRMASLDFAVPGNTAIRVLWLLHTRAVLPVATSLVSPGWKRVGGFLGPDISSFYARVSVERLREIWIEAGIGNVQTRAMSLGGGLIMWGTKDQG